jgi:outer membrane protein TolC
MRTLLLLLTIPTAIATAYAEPPLTLDDAIALGLKKNFDIRIARNRATIAYNNKGHGTAGFLPSLDASGRYIRTDSEQETEPPVATVNSDIDYWSAELALNWTIFDGFAMFIDRARYNDLARQGEEEARRRIEGVILAISRAYFDLVQHEQLLAIARETRDISRSRLDRERTRNELGGASSTDFLNAQVSYNTDESLLLDQELSVLVARQELNLLLGRPAHSDLAVQTEIDIVPLELERGDVLARARENNADVALARLGKSLADRSAQRAWSHFLPRVSAFASYGYADQTVVSDAGTYAGEDVLSQTTNAAIGLSLSFNLFNGGRDRVELQNAKIEAKNQTLALRDAELRIEGEVQETYETFRRQIRLVTLEEQNVVAARQSLDLQQERLQVGATTSLEFRDAQVSVVRTETSLIAARYQAAISRLELERLMGTILPEDQS